MDDSLPWRFLTDGVMGGQSTGQARMVQDGDATFLRMTGRVSTANNGGFIQIRFDLPAPPSKHVTGVEVQVRGNDDRYFVHARTRDSLCPWQFYRAEFQAAQQLRKVLIPFTDFTPSSPDLQAALVPERLTSVAMAAFGRPQDVVLEVHGWQFV